MRRFIRRVCASCFILFIIWCTGLYCFVSQIPTTMPQPIEKADAVVVLTGDAGRIELGISLLVLEKADKLFVSGANQEVSYDDIATLSSASQRDYVRGASGDTIILGTNAQNTIGNAQESKRWLEENQYDEIILVTSHYHMPRSMNEFTQLMPSVKITPVAAIPKGVRGFFWWLEEKHRRMVMSEYYKYVISHLRHWAINNIFVDIT